MSPASSMLMISAVVVAPRPRCDGVSRRRRRQRRTRVARTALRRPGGAGRDVRRLGRRRGAAGPGGDRRRARAARPRAPASTSVRFEPDQGQPMTADGPGRAGSSTDLVLHLPADPGGDPVADVYRVSAKPGRARHGAGAGRPHGDGPAGRRPGRRHRWCSRTSPTGSSRPPTCRRGKHSAEVVPAGTSDDPILGPLDVDLPAGHRDDGLRRRVADERLDERDQPPGVDRHPECRAAPGDRHRLGGAGPRSTGHDVRALTSWSRRRPAGRRSPGPRARGRLRGRRRRSRRRRRPGPPTAARSLEARPAERAGPPDAERPVSVRLPSGTLVPVRPAGTRGRGLLDVPDDVTEAGWWRTGARLGDPFGSTLIAGHVDAVDQGLGRLRRAARRAAGPAGAGPVAGPGADLHDPVPEARAASGPARRRPDLLGPGCRAG